MKAAEFVAPLGRFLGGEVTEVVRLSGGASRETFAFVLTRDGEPGSRPLVMQRVRGASVTGTTSMEAEAELLGAAAVSGVPVAAVVGASDDPTIVGASFVVLERLEGETIARRILRGDEFEHARERLVPQSADALARIHSIDPATVPRLQPEDQLGSLRTFYDMLEPTMGAHPAFELGFRRLGQRRPSVRSDVVVHGDFRFGNLMVDGDGLVAALDWELAHLGDPLEDLAWFSIRAWTFGGPGEVAGMGTLDDLVTSYERASGLTVDRAALQWWRVLQTLRWGVICMMQAHTHLSGVSRSVELATIGRRVCETEYDLLRLLP
jgi:aminoglycoside phosphotransferase (APT) family kinase protein